MLWWLCLLAFQPVKSAANYVQVTSELVSKKRVVSQRIVNDFDEYRWTTRAEHTRAVTNTYLRTYEEQARLF